MLHRTAAQQVVRAVRSPEGSVAGLTRSDMGDFEAALGMLGVAVAVAAGIWSVHLVTSVASKPWVSQPFLSGGRLTEHAVSRFHTRWYTLTLLFLAFDVEMLFMYPWAVVATAMGPSAVVEMSVFLGLLMTGVVYAWRERALEWA